MGSLSVSTHRGLVHWQGLLLVVSLLTFWSLPTTAKISVASTYAVEGKDVLLHVRSQFPEAVGIMWYKGNHMDKNNVIAFSKMTSSSCLSSSKNNEREIVTNDGSLLLKNVTMNDTGIYTIVVHFPDSETEIGTGLLHVYEHLRVPVLRANPCGVIQDGDDVVLTCDTNGFSIQWLFNDMKLKFTKGMNVTANGRKLTIDPVKREDAGVYKCVASNPIMRVESQPLELHVLYY